MCNLEAGINDLHGAMVDVRYLFALGPLALLPESQILHDAPRRRICWIFCALTPRSGSGDGSGPERAGFQAGS
jgi:hypothetical protein